MSRSRIPLKDLGRLLWIVTDEDSSLSILKRLAQHKVLSKPANGADTQRLFRAYNGVSVVNVGDKAQQDPPGGINIYGEIEKISKFFKTTTTCLSSHDKECLKMLLNLHNVDLSSEEYKQKRIIETSGGGAEQGQENGEIEGDFIESTSAAPCFEVGSE